MKVRAYCSFIYNGGHASALEYKQISGRWCIPGVGVMEFTPTQIILNFENGSAHRIYTVEGYQNEGDVIVVNWHSQDWRTLTAFGNLRAGGTLLSQIASDDGPARQMEGCVTGTRTKPNPCS